MSKEKNNKEWFDFLKKVPPDALKPIEAGRLKGYSSINPMWRIEKLTELFGPFGQGWYFTIDEEVLLPAIITDESLIKIKISLYVKVGETENGMPQYCQPAIGYGTSKLIAKERSGLHLDDDAYKKAVTDALGNAAKYFGVGAEVYYKSIDDNKYDNNNYNSPPIDTPSIDEPQRELKPIQPVGKKLSKEELIQKEQVEHLSNVLCANNKSASSALSYINAQAPREMNKAESLDDFTYGEYCEVLSFFKQ